MALVGFKDKFKEELDFIQEALKRTLKRYFMQVFYINLAVFTSLLEHYNYRATSVMRHEVSQLIAGINGLRKNYFIEDSSLKYLYHLDDKALEDINKSINAFLELLDNLLTTNKREIKIYPKNITQLNVLTEILFKWKDFIRLYAKEKNLQIVIDESFPEVIIKADKKIIEPMIFNLLNNAVKYSLRDTVIHIKGELKQDKDKLIIEFINFSKFNMPKNKKGKEKIFELFTRGENIDEGEIEGHGVGHGVGLWVISESAKAHKGKVDYVCNKISDYNISLIEKFIDYKFPEKFINSYFSKDEFYNNYALQDQGSEQDNYKYLLNEVGNEKRKLIIESDNEKFFEKNLAFKRTFSIEQGKFVSDINDEEQILNEVFMAKDLIDYIKTPTYEIKFIIELPVEWKD